MCHLVALALAALLPVLRSQDSAPQVSTLALGRPVPPLEVAEWLDGKPPVVPGHERATVLVFWATWCGACVSEFPRLNELVRELGRSRSTSWLSPMSRVRRSRRCSPRGR